MSKFQQLTPEDLMETKGGKIYHATPWQICNSKTHKCWADNAAISISLRRESFIFIIFLISYNYYCSLLKNFT